MKKVHCPDCMKIVRDKPIFGTIHLCLTPAEKTQLNYMRWQMEQQKRVTANALWQITEQV